MTAGLKEAPIIAAGAAAIDVEMLASFEDVSITAEAWDQFVQQAGCTLFVTYDWCRIWWRHYGTGRSLRIYIFRDGGRVVGLAPMFVETLWLGPVRLKLAKRVGADSPIDVFALPLLPPFARAAYNYIITDLVEREGCDALSLGYLPVDDPTLCTLREHCETLRPIITVARDAVAGVQSVFRLTQDFKTYLERLEKAPRQKYGRHLRRLGRDFTCGSEIVSSPFDAQSTFQAFKTMHKCQWMAEGKLGHFGDWPGSEAFNSDLVEKYSRSGRLRFHRITTDGKAVAFQYTFVFAGVCYWRLPARLPEKRYDRYALGLLSLMQLIEAMIAEGVNRIDGGVGHYDYKLHFGAEEQEIRTFLIVRSHYLAILRARLFMLASDLLHFAYYRVWFLRIAPRLRIPRRPLWRVWVRSRL